MQTNVAEVQHQVPPSFPTKLLTVNEFCARYSVSRSEVYRQRKAGHLPFIKIGKASRIDVVDAEAWLASLRRSEGWHD